MCFVTGPRRRYDSDEDQLPPRRLSQHTCRISKSSTRSGPRSYRSDSFGTSGETLKDKSVRHASGRNGGTGRARDTRTARNRLSGLPRTDATPTAKKRRTPDREDLHSASSSLASSRSTMSRRGGHSDHHREFPDHDLTLRDHRIPSPRPSIHAAFSACLGQQDVPRFDDSYFIDESQFPHPMKDRVAAKKRWTSRAWLTQAQSLFKAIETTFAQRNPRDLHDAIMEVGNGSTSAHRMSLNKARGRITWETEGALLTRLDGPRVEFVRVDSLRSEGHGTPLILRRSLEVRWVDKAGAEIRSSGGGNSAMRQTSLHDSQGPVETFEAVGDRWITDGTGRTQRWEWNEAHPRGQSRF